MALERNNDPRTADRRRPDVRGLTRTVLQPLAVAVTPVVLNELMDSIWAATQGRARAALFPVLFAVSAAALAFCLLLLVGRIYALTIPIFGAFMLVGSHLLASIASRILERWIARSTPEFTVLSELHATYMGALDQWGVLAEDLKANKIPAEEIARILGRKRDGLLQAYLAAIIEVTHRDGAQHSVALRRSIADMVLPVPNRPGELAMG